MQRGCLQVQHVICCGFTVCVWRINKTFIYSTRNIRHHLLAVLQLLYHTVLSLFLLSLRGLGGWIMTLEGVLQIRPTTIVVL